MAELRVGEVNDRRPGAVPRITAAGKVLVSYVGTDGLLHPRWSAPGDAVLGPTGPTGPTGSNGATGATGPTFGSPIEFYCDLGAPADGDGSRARPFNQLRPAVEAAPTKDVCACTIHLAPVNITTHPDGYFDGSPIPVVDKRLLIHGKALFNESPTPTTFGVHLAPHSSDGSNLLIEIAYTNSNIAPTSYGIIIAMRDAHCEALNGTDEDDFDWGATYIMVGSSSRLNIIGSEGTTQSQIDGSNYATNGMTVISYFGMQSGVVVFAAGGVTVLSSATNVIRDSYVGAQLTAAAGAFALYNCVFPDDASGVVITAQEAFTDLATYQRGVLTGVTWPAKVTIVDINVPLPPMPVGTGTGSQSVGNPTPAYGECQAGDLFGVQVSFVHATPVGPTLPAGWILEDEVIEGTLGIQWWWREARAEGDEEGDTVTVTSTNSLCQAAIHTFRNVATAAFVEDESSAHTTGAGPTSIAGPTVNPGGPGRTAILASASNGTTPTALAVTGQTGGTWVDLYQQESGTGALLDLQSATRLGDTISGGTMSMPGTKIARIAFSLVGVVANVPADGASSVPTTRLVSTGANLTGGGDLSADRTLALAAALTGITSINGSTVTAPTEGALTDADATKHISNGAVLVLPAATLSTDRALTLGTSGSPVAGDTITVVRHDATAHDYAVLNHDASPLFTFPQFKCMAGFKYDGADWAWLGTFIRLQ